MADDLKDRIRARLQAYEPDYDGLAQLGETAEAALSELAAGNDAELASRAILLAARLDTLGGVALVERAAGDPRLEVRAAVATSAASLSDNAARVLDRLLADPSPAIRRLAAGQAAVVAKSPELRAKLEAMSESEPDAVVREATKTTLRSLLREN